MCGIAGIQANNRALVQSMIAELGHRGPDSDGIVVTEKGTLGHTRLAIIDLASGQQPMQVGKYLICFNGEIYNYRELRDRYLRDVPMQTTSDTEVIVHLYARFGASCVRLLDGMFAFAILDQGELFLARDPLGIKPLYYGRRDGVLCFASEISALGPIVDALQTLPPGTTLHSVHGLVHYYEVGEGWPLPNAICSPTQAHAAIRSVTAAAVRKRLLADVPVGVSLSGGLDSSIIALCAQADVERLETFAVGVAGSADLAAARLVAQTLGTQHHEYVYTQQEMLTALPDVLQHLESCDPALVRSAIPNYFLARLACEHVKVILGGEGADELYGGYAYMCSYTTPEQLHSELLHTLRELHRTNLQRADRMFMAFGVEGRVPFLDRESVALALSLPAEWKLTRDTDHTKQLLRDAYAGQLPAAIIRRPKQKFSSGAGSADLMATLAEAQISDLDFQHEHARLLRDWGYQLPNKEALFYYQMLREHLPDSWLMLEMGTSRSL